MGYSQKGCKESDAAEHTAQRHQYLKEEEVWLDHLPQLSSHREHSLATCSTSPCRSGREDTRGAAVPFVNRTFKVT